jgi:hypothetical protein
MTKERIKIIKDDVLWKQKQAERIMVGDGDNYDGADGARYMLIMCEYVDELIEALEERE